MWPILSFISAFFFGLCLGSFLNAWVWRTHEGLSIIRGRSLCPHCRTSLSWYDNIPVVSFFLLRGKCRHCEEKISWQYPLVESSVALLFVGAAIYHRIDLGVHGVLLRDWALIVILSFIFLYDGLYGEILDFVTLIPAGVFFFFSILFGLATWDSMLIGGLVGGGFFLVQYVVSKGKWIGGGDVRLGVLMGVVLGWPGVLVALMIAYIGGALLCAPLLLLKRRGWNSELPFGTFLTVATLATLWSGPYVLAWYMSFLR